MEGHPGCHSKVGRYDNGPTDTVLPAECYTGDDKFHDGIAWIVLHEVSVCF